MTAVAERARTGVAFNEKNHRYTIDGKYVVSVTTALKGVPKDEALVYWSARSVAEYVVDNLDHVSRMAASGGRGPTVAFLQGIPNQARDTAAIRGTDVHTYAERIMRNEEVEVPHLLVPYVEGYLHFLEDFEPTSVLDEVIVASREYGYAGRLDSAQNIPGLGFVIVDYKTGNRVYGEAALQVAAYRYAEFYMDGALEVPLPAVEDTFVLHIQPNEYQLLQVAADRAAFERFLTAKDNYLSNVQSNKLAKLIGEPVEPPRRDLP